MTKLTLLIPCVLSTALLSSNLIQAETFEVTITNITAGQVLTPPLTFTHNSQISLFKVGQQAPEYLAPLAEDGNSGIFSGIDALPQVNSVNIAEGPILPGQSITFNIDANAEYPLITVAGMLASSNDALLSIHDQKLDFSFDSSTYNGVVYDAGTERNSENCDFIPGPPCGNGGVRDTDGAEGFVHIHSGIHGIDSLSPEKYSWNNPAAHINIKRVK
jgi:hypothetical protein